MSAREKIEGEHLYKNLKETGKAHLKSTAPVAGTALAAKLALGKKNKK